MRTLAICGSKSHQQEVRARQRAEAERAAKEELKKQLHEIETLLERLVRNDPQVAWVFEHWRAARDRYDAALDAQVKRIARQLQRQRSKNRIQRAERRRKAA